MTLEKQELHLEEAKKRIRMANMIQQEANKLRMFRILSAYLLLILSSRFSELVGLVTVAFYQELLPFETAYDSFHFLFPQTLIFSPI